MRMESPSNAPVVRSMTMIKKILLKTFNNNRNNIFRSFVTPVILNGHESVQQKKGTFQCSECSAVFTRASSVKRHLSRNSPLEKFFCTICKKDFSTLKCVRAHLKVFFLPYLSRIRF